MREIMKTITVNKTASKGIVIGRALVVKKADLSPATYTITTEDVEEEILKFEQALDKAVNQLQKIVVLSDIFAGHLMLAEDIILREAVISKIKMQKNVEQSLSEAIEELAVIFDNLEDEYMRERSADIRDVGNRILKIIKGVEEHSLVDIKDKVIVVVGELSPSDIAVMDLRYVIGFIAESGGVTSHVSIIAKNIGLPACVGVRGILQEISSGDWLIMDASAGLIILSPDDPTIHRYEVLQDKYLQIQMRLKESVQLPGITLDGRKVELCANVGSLEELRKAVAQNIAGIGLFRTEFLYMENNHFPSEEEQYIIYKEAAMLCDGGVILRTLDIGGDKTLPYYSFEKEDNPYLGWRGIRISLDMPEVFKTQLCAILRASYYGKLKIMLPMIISIEELEQAKEIIEQCKKELRNRQIPFDDMIEVGIMVETPAAVINIKDFAKNVDFLSIGTNDLTQYILAVDRGNRKLSNLYDTYHPAVLRSIGHIIETGHQFNKRVGMCGEFAGDSKAIRLLLGMGLDEFSMSAGSIAEVKDIIRSSNYSDAVILSEKVLAAETVQEIMNILHNYTECN
ncbi:MAG TPA: phosphoenolpyruvate--protein phosphotransferase [Mobilitalea sp.]|nr:phosphoenolpyruvate--protein phosphotransferase [Mobilitalea sp.]